MGPGKYTPSQGGGESSMQLCTICDKPFTKAAAFKRHVSYCRRRAATQPRKRLRSCARCNAAKVKCSFSNPCSRCSGKGLDCDYGIKPAVPLQSPQRPEIAAPSSLLLSQSSSSATLAGPEVLASPAPYSSCQAFPLSVEHQQSLGNSSDDIAGGMLTDPSSLMLPGMAQQFQDQSSLTVGGSFEYPFAAGSDDDVLLPGWTNDTEGINLHLDEIYNIDAGLETLMRQKYVMTPSPDLLQWPGDRTAESNYTMNDDDILCIDDTCFTSSTTGAGAGAAEKTPRRQKILEILPIIIHPSPFQPRSIPSSLSAPLPRPRPLALLARDPVARHNSRLIIESLRAYPAMMTRRQTFPPFIHPHWHRKSSSSCSPLPSPLESCMSLCRAFAAVTRDGNEEKKNKKEEERMYRRRCLWEAVGEQEQTFWNQREHSTMEDQLAQLQAMLVYIIMRVVDGESAGGSGGDDGLSDSTAGAATSTTPVIYADTLMVYQEICRRLLPKVAAAQMEPRTGKPTWGQWIFDESCRRVVCLWFLISRVIDIRGGIWCPMLCNSHAIPLPSARALWEARGEEEWREALEDSDRSREDGLLLSLFGDLRDARRGDGPAGRSPRFISQKLAAWSANVDGMGYLANLATTVV